MSNSIGGNLSSSFIIQLLGAQNQSMQLAHNIFFAVVLGLLLPPLYRLSKERSALFILFSKALSSLLTSVSVLLSLSILKNLPSPWNYVWTVNSVFYFVMRLHVLALAANRAHSVLFPFHYSQKVKAKHQVQLCVLLWLLSVLFAAGHTYLIRTGRLMFVATWVLPPYNYLCIFGALALYLAVLGKMAWLRYNSSARAEGASTEKDLAKICFVFFSSLIPFLLTFLAQLFSTLVGGFGESELQGAAMVCKMLSGLLVYCTEEICLLFAIQDYRRLFRSHIAKLVSHCFFCWKSAAGVKKKRDQQQQWSNKTPVDANVSTEAVFPPQHPSLARQQRQNWVK